MRARLKNHLLVVDPQNDFCDLPVGVAGGPSQVPALPIAGGHEDMLRLSRFLDRMAVKSGRCAIDEITVTLDSHPVVAIERPAFWRQGDGQDVVPFTEITLAAFMEGRFVPRQADLASQVENYLRRLELGGKYRLMVWPTHCVTGTWGHNIHAALAMALDAWERQSLTQVAKVLKGMNPMTEQYSAIRAEVPIREDESTHVNRALVRRTLRPGQRLIIAGEAASHCVRATMLDLYELCQNGDVLKNMVLVSDAMSPVTGFEKQTSEFFEYSRSLGVTVATLSTVEALLCSES